ARISWPQPRNSRQDFHMSADGTLFDLGVAPPEPVAHLVSSDDIGLRGLEVGDHIPHQGANRLLVESHFILSVIEAPNVRGERPAASMCELAVRCAAYRFASVRSLGSSVGCDVITARENS